MTKLINKYKTLSPYFYSPESLPNYPEVKLLKMNDNLLGELVGEMSSVERAEWVNLVSGTDSILGIETMALAYSGHQFGHFNPTLGDGRALLLGQIETSKGLLDLQLKGSGRTKYSRRGDGKSALGPAIREYIVSEYMNTLGVPTTRSLAVVSTGENVFREEGELAGGMLTRVAHGHIRIGTFEFALHFHGESGVKELADHVIENYYPDLLNHSDKYFEFYKTLSENYLNLVCKWMSLGFIHGVMNTDNASVTGETIDYGPCAFMDEFNFQKVFSFIDQQGRYRYANQPRIALWNLSVLGMCLSHLIDQNKVETELQRLADSFPQKELTSFARKLGVTILDENSSKLVRAWIATIEKNHLDFTQSFYFLTKSVEQKQLNPFFENVSELKDLFSELPKLNPNPVLMRKTNPSLIPRNHQIEEVIQSAYKGEMNPFYEMLKSLENPFNEMAESDKLFASPLQHERVKNTFCGT